MGQQNYNWKILGHEKQLRALEQDLAGGNLPHAYLFAGPSQIGKYTLARRLAQILQCEAGAGQAPGCGTCGVCINIEKSYHADTLEIADNGETIKIETMRNTLARMATTSPAKYKILLIENIERMTQESANALLKTLEEPGSQVVFLFTTNHLEDVLQTVLSRIRLVKFNSNGPEEILQFLKEKHPLEPEDKLKTVTDFSFGLAGRAIFFVEHPEDFEKVQVLFERVRNVLERGDIVEKFALVAEVTQDEKLFSEFFDIFLLALRYTMLQEAELNGAESATSEKLQRTVSVLLQAQESVRLQKRNVNVRLLFEHLMLQT